MAAQDVFRDEMRSSKVDFDAFMEDMAMVVTYVAGDETGAMNASRSPASLTPSPSIEADMQSSLGSRTESPSAMATPLSAFNLGAAAIVSSRRSHNSAALLVDMDEIASALNASYEDTSFVSSNSEPLTQPIIAAPVASHAPKVITHTITPPHQPEATHVVTRGARAVGRSDAPRPIGFPARTASPPIPNAQNNTHQSSHHGSISGSATWGSPSSNSTLLSNHQQIQASSSPQGLQPHHQPSNPSLSSHIAVNSPPMSNSSSSSSITKSPPSEAAPLPPTSTSTSAAAGLLGSLFPPSSGAPSSLSSSLPSHHHPSGNHPHPTVTTSSLPSATLSAPATPLTPSTATPFLNFPPPTTSPSYSPPISNSTSPMVSPRAIPPGGFVSAFPPAGMLSAPHGSGIGQAMASGGVPPSSSSSGGPPSRPITPPMDGSDASGRQRTRAAAPMPAGRAYASLEEIILDPNISLLKALCTCLQVTEATKTCASIVMIFEKKERVLAMIQQMIEFEVSMQKTAATLFRNNSLTTHMMTCYTKLVGLPFLKNIIGPVILDAFAAIEEGHVTYEIDPSKIGTYSNGSGGSSGQSDGKKSAPIATVVGTEVVLTAEQSATLKANVKDLKGLVHTFFDRILNSRAVMPKNFMEICNTLQMSTVDRFPESRYFVIGGFLFLRYICPAVVAPDGYKLINASISDKQRRMLVLVSKILQTIANERTFGEKEQYMMCMNQLVNEYQGMVQYFFNQLAKPVLPNTPDNVPTIVITPEDYSLALKQVLTQVKGAKAKLLQHPIVVADPKLSAAIESIDSLPLQ